LSQIKYKIIKDALTTSNTKFIKTGKNSYSIQHYKHEILRVTNGKIKKLLPVSRTSYSAIVQGLKYLKLPANNVKDLCMKLNGKDMDTLQAEFKPNLVS
jgi:hypothetical protein